MRTLALLIAFAACGGSSAPTPAASSGPPASLVATGAADGDVQVATVNGRPVWGSCVTAQATGGKSREDALRECVDFELMAQAAEARGLATDHEVVQATHTALVSQLVAYDYEAKYTKPGDFGAIYDQLVAKNLARADHDEYRASAYVRIDVPKGATPAQDEAAHALMTEVAAATANERGLLPQHLKDIAEKVVGIRAKVSFAVVGPYLPRGLDPSYSQALFALPEIGRTAGPVRTSWGWDVILWSDVVPAVHPTPEQLAEKMLPDVKRSYFTYWVNTIASRLGVKITIFDKNLPALESI
jgi:hypothetical protein